MAEFCEVMKQMKRMCKTHESCRECQMPRQNKEYSCPLYSVNSEVCEVEKIERIVMDWAAANTEPRYPSWNEAWKQLFPDGEKTPCPRYFTGGKRLDEYCIGKCSECKNLPIPADIAEKLGIKPMGGENDGNG